MPPVRRHRASIPFAVLKLGPGLMVKVIAAALLAFAVIWLTLSVSIASVTRDSLPRVALAWAPYDARTMGAIAEDTLITSADLDKAKASSALARRALQRDPTVIAAWRTIGLAFAAGGRESDATRVMEVTNRLSRRDLQTQLWLIEDNVRRNDVDGALRHYDIALRTSSEATEMLLPILVTAIDQPALVDPEAGLIASNPPWAPSFFDFLTREPPRSDNAAALLEMVRQKGYVGTIPNASQLPLLLAQRGDYDAALRTYRALQLSDGTIKDVNDQFAKSPKLLPFDWDFAATSDIRAEPQLREHSASRAALHVLAANGAVGTAARKLFTLPPGAYVLGVAVDSQGALPEALKWTMRCASRGASLLLTDVTPKARGRTLLSLTFHVPANCGAQWLELSVRAPEGFDPAELWIESLTVQPEAKKAGARPALTDR